MLWCPPASSDPVDLVNPDIGGVPHLLQPTIPMVHRPFGMVRLAREPKGYQQERIDSFPLNLPAHRGPAVGRLMPGLGELSPDPAAWGSAYDHDFETCTPYRYGVLLEDTGIVAEMTTTARAACYRFIFPSSDGHVCLALQGDCGFERLDECTVGGYEAFGDVRMYFALRAELPLKVTSLGEADGTRVTLVADTDTLVLRSGISWLSVEQARQNLEAEVAGRSFEQIAGASRDAWNEELGKITVEGGEPTQRRVFYSALYRCCERMYECSENGRYYSPHLGKVCEDGGSPHFTDDWIWDTFRAMHPLHVLIDGDREAARLRSYLRVYEESGGMPYFPKMNGNFPIMNGHHVTAVFADAWAKGLRGFDAELAYEGLRKTAMQETMLPWRAGPLTELDRCYQEHGFFPGLPPGAEETVAAVNPGEKRQSVAVSLARAYDDWCLAQLARSLGKEEDAEFFLARADWYRRSYNPAHGFFAPRDESGAWIEPFDAKFSGGQGAREYFDENNGWTYLWDVQHDPAGLRELMGGAETFEQRLDQLFIEGPGTAPWAFFNQFPDATGRVGQFAMGNEPSMHVPYLYAYCGAPWKTAKRVRSLLDLWYTDTPLGISGDEDGGGLTSWAVFSMLGFYPVTPGRPMYVLGSPVFERATLRLSSGAESVIDATGASHQNKYIQGAAVNGTPLDRAWFRHDEIATGGTLRLEMGARPNRDWGSDPEQFPPSMSTNPFVE